MSLNFKTLSSESADSTQISMLDDTGVKTNIIYGLVDPRDKEIKYIGKTTSIKNLPCRLNRHLKDTDRCPRTNWFKTLKKENLRPTYEVLDIVPELEWEFWERWWISQFKAWGLKLKNYLPGGEGVPKGHIPWNKGKTNVYSLEVRKRISDSIKAKKAYKIFPSEYNTVLQLYKKGFSQMEIAKIYKTSTHPIVKILKSANVKTRTWSKISSQEKQNILDYYLNNNVSVKDAANYFGYTQGVLSRILKINRLNGRNFRGRITTLETKLKISASSKLALNNGKFKKGQETWNAKQIIQLTKENIPIKTWRSQNEAKTILGIKNIHKCITGERLFAGGYKWKQII